MQNLKLGRSTIKRSAGWGAILALFTGLIAAPTPSSAQQATASTDVPVHMVVTVEPRHGGQPPALAADDVKVYQRTTQNR